MSLTSSVDKHIKNDLSNFNNLSIVSFKIIDIYRDLIESNKTSVESFVHVKSVYIDTHLSVNLDFISEQIQVLSNTISVTVHSKH